MPIDSRFETLEVVAEPRQPGRALCGAQTTSGSICRAAPMANGVCVQHGGRAKLAAGDFSTEHDGTASGEGRLDPGETIDRLGVGLDHLLSLSRELPLARRQHLVPELRALAGRALWAYNELLAQNRLEAAAKLRRAAAS